MSVTHQYNSGEVTFVPGFVRGFRAWSLNLDIVGLRSITRVWDWRPGENRAACGIGDGCSCEVCSSVPRVHEAPFPQCSCGIYARYVNAAHGYSGVQGIIKATGNVIIGTAGFRAEVAQIEALVATSIDREWLRQMLLPPHLRVYTYGTRPRPSWAPPGDDWSQVAVTKALAMLSEVYQVPVFDSFYDAQKAFPFPDLSELTKKEATCPEATTPVSP